MKYNSNNKNNLNNFNNNLKKIILKNKNYNKKNKI